MIREADAQSAKADGDENTLWMSASSAISNVSLRYTRSRGSIDLFELDMHDLWHLYYHTSMNIGHDRVEQDRLIVQILSARELGVLARQNENEATRQEAVTKDGTIWKDLPFLVGDLTKYWITGKMTINQRTNYASFLAKLSAAGVGNDKLCGCALIVLRDALETLRPTLKGNAGAPGIPDNDENEDKQWTIESLSVAELLPIANMWLFKAGNKLVELSEKSANFFPNDLGKLGELARAGGVPDSVGFSPQRWLFWYQRLQTLETETADQDFAALARGVKNNMVSSCCESESQMSHELRRRDLLAIS